MRLVAPEVASPFAPGREVVLARLSGSLLERAGLRDGDHVALARRDRAEAGSFAAVVGAEGADASLWRVYPEGARLRLTTGADYRPEALLDDSDSEEASRAGLAPGVPEPSVQPDRVRWASRSARVQGIVVGVLRKLCG